MRNPRYDALMNEAVKSMVNSAVSIANEYPEERRGWWLATYGMIHQRVADELGRRIRKGPAQK